MTSPFDARNPAAAPQLRSNGRAIWLVLALSLLLVVLTVPSAYRWRWADHILPGVWVDAVNVGGLTRVIQDVPPFMILEGHPARVRKVNVNFGDETSAILIADSTGRIVEDVQPMTSPLAPQKVTAALIGLTCLVVASA